MRLTWSLLAVAFLLLAGCTASPSAPPQGVDICAHVTTPPPTTLPPGATPWTSPTFEPGPYTTPPDSRPLLPPGDWEVYARPDWSGFHRTGMEETVIRDDAAWSCFWQLGSGGGASGRPIDFDEETILAITLGPKPTAGFAIHPMDVEREGERYVVRYAPVEPAPECAMASSGPGDRGAPTLLLRHRPTGETIPYEFVREEPRVWDCQPIVDDLHGGESVAVEVTNEDQGMGGGPLAGFEAAGVLVANESQPWHPYLGAQFSDAGAMPDRMNESFLLAATVGYRPHTGFLLELQSVEWRNGTYEVRFLERTPGDHCAVGMMVTLPYVLAWVERIDEGPPKVEALFETRQQPDCPLS